MFSVSEALVLIGLLSAGVVYGTDAFFAVVGRPALAQVKDSSLVDAMGHLHSYADARMPIFGVMGLGSTAALVFITGFGSAASRWAILAVVGLGVQLGAYLTVSKPINTALTAAAKQKVTLAGRTRFAAPMGQCDCPACTRLRPRGRRSCLSRAVTSLDSRRPGRVVTYPVLWLLERLRTEDVRIKLWQLYPLHKDTKLL